MLLMSRRNVFGVCVGLMLFGLGNESASAWQFGGGAAVAKPARRNPRDATASLEKRVAQEKEGRELFVRDWSRSDSKPAPGGDGLGPMYNDVSCVACHEQGGTGGGGPIQKNVRLLHLVAASGAPLRTTVTSEASQKTRLQVHPDLSGVTSLVLHRHQFKDGAELADYQHWLGQRLPRRLVDRTTHLPLVGDALNAFVNHPQRNPLDLMSIFYRAEGLPVRMTERNTPALFGAGLIDSIPDAVIVEQAERQKKHNAPLITGRVPTNASGAVGRFGWRGQVSSLREFVMTACSVELGLNVPEHQQARPVVMREKFMEAVGVNGEQRGSDPKLDLTQEQCNSLTEYVANLPAPQMARSDNLNQAKVIQRGSVLFEKVGCAICHVQDVGPVAGLFSDLLLHDMGPNLSDPLPAIPELDERISPGNGSAYGQSIRIELVKNITTNIHQEWRTPPLWGVGNSAPYLHDGRAVTLEQAIQMHGGEGQRAAEAFRSLKHDERTDLLVFLRSLTSPEDGPVRMPRMGGGAAGRGGGGGGFF